MSFVKVTGGIISEKKEEHEYGEVEFQLVERGDSKSNGVLDTISAAFDFHPKLFQMRMRDTLTPVVPITDVSRSPLFVVHGALTVSWWKRELFQSNDVGFLRVMPKMVARIIQYMENNPDMDDLVAHTASEVERDIENKFREAHSRNPEVTMDMVRSAVYQQAQVDFHKRSNVTKLMEMVAEEQASNPSDEARKNHAMLKLVLSVCLFRCVTRCKRFRRCLQTKGGRRRWIMHLTWNFLHRLLTNQENSKFWNASLFGFTRKVTRICNIVMTPCLNISRLSRCSYQNIWGRRCFFRFGQLM